MTTAQTEARAVAPDRIWVTGSFHMGAYASGSWNVQKLSNSRTDLGELEYVRADLHAGVLTTKDAELAALKKQVEELTAERDDARRYAVEARLRENQAEDRRVSESFARTKAEAEVAALRTTLSELLFYVDQNTCTHEATHRGGAIWTICDDCGEKWADDRGGFVPYSDPEPVAHARAALASTRETSDAG